MKRAFLASALVLGLSALGCVSSTTPAVPPTVTPPSPRPDPAKPDPNSPRARQFQQALDEMASLDGKDGWTAGACERVANAFLGVAQEKKPDALDVKAHFNAGVAYERCARDDDAGAQFEHAVALDGDFHPARVHLILWRHKKSNGKDIDESIAAMRKTAIVDARYQNVEALVALAMLSLERGKDIADTDGVNDRARAVRYLQSALAVDDGYSPAMNGLALYYLDEARASSGRKIARTSDGNASTSGARGTQAMELAALVCAQAIQKDPSDAVIHNTYGLIQVELGNLGKAAESFGKARALRPGFYEAEMNYAAVNLQFRGFSKAEEAYRAVLTKRPGDYDARLGLSLALRGQIQPENADSLVAQATSELEKAKQLAPDRPEAYYNEAILIQEYKARGDGAATRKELAAAQELFREFVKKAGSAPELADAVKRAGERIAEIDAIAKFLSESPKNGS